MKRALRARVVVLSLAIAGVTLGGRLTARAAAPEQPRQVASVDQLKTEAFKALRAGQFDRTNELLSQAAAMSHDPSVERMATWTSSFEHQREEFAAERHKQFDKIAKNIKLLLDKHHPDYALDASASAYNLADNKDAYTSEPMISTLVKGSITRAQEYNHNEQWVKALRIYSDLSVLEPSVPQWKDQLKLATRRVRLLALYTPDALKQLQESEKTEREQVEALLKPTPTTRPAATQPASHPATQPSADAVDADGFKVDWHETLRGVKFDMLWDALVDAKRNYYREVNYKQLALGGLKGLQALVSTQGLEKAFPGLDDPAKKASFIEVLDDAVAENNNATDDTSQRLALRTSLTNIITRNRKTVQIPDEVLFSEFADGAFAECDPFTSMIWPADVAEFNKTTQGEFSGVGIQIQNDGQGNLKVVTPLEDTPAYHSGIRPDDIITAIDGKSAKNISTSQAVRSITGKSGSLVTLTIKSPDGHVKDHTLKRETIHVSSVKGWMRRPGARAGWDFMIDPENKIAYMRMTNFTADTPKELDQAVERIKEKGGKAIILDLRYNPGGLLRSATEVADKFLRKGLIVSTRPDRNTGNPPTAAVAGDDPTDCDLPLIVLVNQYSASASEIVSGALKDDNRALIVGERSFGKGSVQMLFPLADRTAYLKLTTSHYYLPSGRCLHREENSKDWGVDPDVKIEMTPEQMRAAIDARQDLDILRDADAPAQGEKPKLQAQGEKVATAKPKKDLLSSDPQLSAALLLLKLQLAGAQI